MSTQIYNSGDLVQVYVSKMKGGASTGRGVNGNPDHLQWVIFNHYLYGPNMFSACWTDGSPIGLPFSVSDIVGHQPDAGYEILKEKRAQAAKKGLVYLVQYAKIYDSLPDGFVNTPVLARSDYKYFNAKAKIKNKHKLYQSKNLILLDIKKDVATIKCCDTNKIAEISAFGLHINQEK